MLADLLQRKAKADALAVAADRYSAAFAELYPAGDLNGLADAAREIIEIIGKGEKP